MVHRVLFPVLSGVVPATKPNKGRFASRFAKSSLSHSDEVFCLESACLVMVFWIKWVGGRGLVTKQRGCDHPPGLRRFVPPAHPHQCSRCLSWAVGYHLMYFIPVRMVRFGQHRSSSSCVLQCLQEIEATQARRMEFSQPVRQRPPHWNPRSFAPHNFRVRQKGSFGKGVFSEKSILSREFRDL